LQDRRDGRGRKCEGKGRGQGKGGRKGSERKMKGRGRDWKIKGGKVL